MGCVTGKAVWGAAVALWLLLPAEGAAADRLGKLDAALRQAVTSGGPQRVIVRARPGKVHAIAGRVASMGRLGAQHGLIEAVAATLSGDDIAALASDPDVESISGDHDVAALARPGAGGSSAGVLRDLLGLRTSFTGANITVALIDSGIAPVPDLAGRIVAFFDFSDGGHIASTPYDTFGHGTHVAGLIGSSGASSRGKYSGVATGVRFVGLKVLDETGIGKTSDVIRALEFAVLNKDTCGIRVVNLSLGHPVYESAQTDPLVNAVEAAVRAGLIVVVAAGNDGYQPITGDAGFAGIVSPGNSPSAITVGAAATNNTVVRADDHVARFSSRGPSWFDGFAKPDVVAPGQGLASSDVPGSTLGATFEELVFEERGTKYLKLSGSSMASGVVSGLVAVMLEAQESGALARWKVTPKRYRSAFAAPPGFTANAVKAMLQYSATPLHDEAGRPYGPLEQGTGLVNGYGALALAYVTDSTTSVGEYWQTSPVPASNPFGGIETAWSQQVIWGTRLLTGGSTIELKQLAWEEDNIVWGTGEIFDIVWGTASTGEDNVVWGTLAAEEDNIVWGTAFHPSLDLAWAGNAAFEEDNIVWGTAVRWDDHVVWGADLIGYFDGFNIVWGTCTGEEDNIVWGTLDRQSIVGSSSARRIVTALNMPNIGG